MDDLRQWLDSITPDFNSGILSFLDRYLSLYGRRITTALDFCEDALRTQMAGFGLSHDSQTIILLAGSLILIVAIMKLFRTWLRLVVVLMLFTFGVRVLLTNLQT